MRKQLPLVGEMTGNLAAADMGVTSTNDYGARYINGYFEQYKSMLDASQKFEFVKRPGISNNVVDTLTPPLTGTTTKLLDGFRSQSGNGGVILLWTHFSGAATDIQVSYNGAVSAAPAGWVNGPVAILCPLDNAIMGYEAAVCGSNDGGLIASGGAFTRIVSANYLAGPLSGGSSGSPMVYMDGYLFQANWVNCKIYNSDLNNPNSWTATGFITASLYPGVIVTLKRLRHYVVAFKEASVEFFENQGNPTPGSPLGPVKQLSRPIGCAHASYVKNVNDGIIFVGKDSRGLVGVWKLFADSLELKKISDSFVDGILAVGSNLLMFKTGGGQSNIQVAGCNVIPWKGREFYNLPLSVTGSGFSLVYDNSNGSWLVWTQETQGGGVQRPFETNAVVSTGPNVYLGYGDSELNGNLPRLLNELSYKDYIPNSAGSVSFPFRWISPSLDFGSLRRKFMSSFEVYYKLGGAGIGSNGTLSMYYHDDDHGTPSNARTGTTTPAGGRIIWRQLGSFRHRRFVLETTSDTPMRIGAIEVDIQVSDADLD